MGERATIHRLDLGRPDLPIWQSPAIDSGSRVEFYLPCGDLVAIPAYSHDDSRVAVLRYCVCAWRFDGPPIVQVLGVINADGSPANYSLACIPTEKVGG